MQTHTGVSKNGDSFYIVPDRTGFHFSLILNDVTYYEFIERSSLNETDVNFLIEKMENEYGGKGKQTKTLIGDKENL